MLCFTQESREACIGFRTRSPTWWWLARGRVIFEDVELCRYPASPSPSDTLRRRSPKSRSRALTRGGGRGGKACACALSCTANSRSILLVVFYSNNGNDQLRLSAIEVTRSAPPWPPHFSDQHHSPIPYYPPQCGHRSSNSYVPPRRHPSRSRVRCCGSGPSSIALSSTRHHQCGRYSSFQEQSR